MSKAGKSSKFNPITAVFVPGKSISSTSSAAANTSAQQNMSSHAAPPPSNIKSKAGFNNKKPPKGQKPREPRLHSGGKNAIYHDELDDFAFHLDDDLIAGANFPRARRGQVSINHLLDFSLPSREPDQHQGTSSNISRRRRRSSNKDRIHLVGKEFVNANYRFVVDYRSDYNGQALDPNLLLDHSQILRVIVPKSHHCPICLGDDIVAPRMISCGHIFCHTCLLSFLDSEPLEKRKAEFYTPKKLKECPLCSQYVRPDETIPVLVSGSDERFEIPKIGEDVVLRLMARPMDSILPIPHSFNLNHQKIGNFPWYSDTELNPYARIMKSGLKFIVDCYEKEKVQILNQYEEDKTLYNDDGKYVEKAISEIDMHLEVMKKSFNNADTEPNPLVTSMDNLSISKNSSGLNDSNCYFFYQTSFNSTTRYFLSPLDVKVLLRTYGSYSEFPQTLLLKVDNVNSGYMVTEQTLKRYKYMAHLPLGTEFAFIDVNWKNMLPPEIYKLFNKELSDRRRKLLAKMKREDRDKKTYETEQEIKTREFYMQENEGWASSEFLSSQENFGQFTPALEGQLHPLGDEELQGHEEAESRTEPKGAFTTTVWGTKIPKASLKEDQDDIDDPFNTEELLKFALSKDQQEKGKKKKGRKKLILVSSSVQPRGYS